MFERASKDFGLPLAIRTNNGTPFASTSAFFGLSQLSVWWLRLGIGIERIKPGNPQQNAALNYTRPKLHAQVGAPTGACRTGVYSGMLNGSGRV